MQSLSQTSAKPAAAGGAKTSATSAAGPATGAAHTIQTPPKRGMAKGEAWGTTRRDYAVDPAKAQGEAMSVLTSSGTAVSSDGLSTTMRYFEALEQDPMASEADLWTRATRADLNKGGSVTTFQQPQATAKPTQAPSRDSRMNLMDGWQPAQMPRDNLNLAPKPIPRVPSKGPALVVGNADYKSPELGDLPGARRDADAMARRYADRGYAVQRVADLDTAELDQSLRGLTQGLAPQQEAAFYYAGHGAPQGLIGVDSDVSSNGMPTKWTQAATLSGAVSAALSRGAKLEVVTDACGSGFMAGTINGAQGKVATLKNEDKQGIDYGDEAKKGFSVSGNYLDKAAHADEASLLKGYADVHDGG